MRAPKHELCAKFYDKLAIACRARGAFDQANNCAYVADQFRRCGRVALWPKGPILGEME